MGGPDGGMGGGDHQGPPPSGGSISPSGYANLAPPPNSESGPRFGPSTGTVDITNTYSAAEDCSGAITQDQSVAFNISRTADDGSVSTVQGTTTSTADLVSDGPPQQKQTNADVTRTLTDASGTVVSSVHLTGALTVAFSSDTPPTRTINGSYNETYQDGTTGTVTLADIVRPPRSVCAWPTSGTLTRAASDGTSHVLAFGPDCGAATLDGAAVTLPDRGARRQEQR